MPTSDPLNVAQLLIGLMDEGRRTATYKLAVMLALVDCCSEATGPDGRAPQQITVRQLARRVIELYWQQVLPYADHGVLRQSSQSTAVTVEAVETLRAVAAPVGASSPRMAEERIPVDYERCLHRVELNLVRMPLGKLQRPHGYIERDNADYPRFLYDDSPFHEQVTAARLRAEPLLIELAPGAGDALIALARLLRPLLELHWTREVARFSRLRLDEESLRIHLFGATRQPLRRLAPGLLEAQAGRCFYCDGHLRPGSVDVDHFVPWARVPNDALANLVLADRRCNNAKRDHLPDLGLVERWAERPMAPVVEVGQELRWPVDCERSHRIAVGVYSHLPPGQPLWSGPGVFSLLEPKRWSAVLPMLAEPCGT
jgi:5-methylcytosine-specific restriction endonuclease McrA